MRNKSVERDVAALAGVQGGVIGTGQLAALGVDRFVVRRWVQAGRLHPWLHGVYAVGHTRVGALGRRMAAVLACGEGSVISHQTAADEWDLIRSASGVIHVSVPTPGGRKGHHQVRIHRRPHLPAVSKTTKGALPIITREQTLLDIALTTKPTRLAKAIDQAHHGRVIDHTTLTGLARSGQPGARRLREALKLPATPTRSELEDAFLDLCDSHGIPRPLVNTQIGPYLVDFLWPEDHLIVETDGYEHHGTRQAFNDDRRRDADLLAAYGLTTLRFTYDDVTRAAASTARTIQAVRAGPRPARSRGTRGGWR